jgi:anti-sigma factor RsiW
VETAMAHAISQAAPYYKAPPELRERIQVSLREAIGAPTSRGATRDDSLPVRRPEAVPRGVFFDMPWNWLALAAAIALAAIVAFTFLPRLRQPGADQFLATQLIASHVRSLMADHLTDVASSDQHTVKPWLDVKLDFAAPVVDLSGDGFPLIGGRLDYLDNHSAAALVYQRRKHFINLFIWPTTPVDGKGQKIVEREGYHLVHWIDGDFTYWAVSDVSVGDLQNFKQLFEEQVLHR